MAPAGRMRVWLRTRAVISLTISASALEDSAAGFRLEGEVGGGVLQPVGRAPPLVPTKAAGERTRSRGGEFFPQQKRAGEGDWGEGLRERLFSLRHKKYWALPHRQRPKGGRRPCPLGPVNTIRCLFGGKGNPSAGAGGVPLPPKPPIPSPARFYQGKKPGLRDTPAQKVSGPRMAYLLYLLELFVKFVLIDPNGDRSRRLQRRKRSISSCTSSRPIMMFFSSVARNCAASLLRRAAMMVACCWLNSSLCSTE